MALLSIIIPCYYNEQNIPVTTQRLLENEKNFPEGTSFEYVMVDDGSKDNTLGALRAFYNAHPAKVKIVKLAGNVGSYNAILAGMNYASGDCCCVITADLQDPVELMPKMFSYWEKGVKLVIANRTDREDSVFQKAFANSYHFLLKKFALKMLPKGGFDYVLFDQQLRAEVVKIDEKNTNTLFLLPWLGYDFVSIPYTRVKREIGKSRWTLQKKIKLFIDSFVSFTNFPLRLISAVGLILGMVSFLYLFFIVYAKISGQIKVEGWSTLMIVFLFVSSFQMIALGVIGEYMWRVLDASRKRPAFVVEEVIGKR